MQAQVRLSPGTGPRLGAGSRRPCHGPALKVVP